MTKNGPQSHLPFGWDCFTKSKMVLRNCVRVAELVKTNDWRPNFWWIRNITEILSSWSVSLAKKEYYQLCEDLAKKQALKISRRTQFCLNSLFFLECLLPDCRSRFPRCKRLFYNCSRYLFYNLQILFRGEYSDPVSLNTVQSTKKSRLWIFSGHLE